MARKAKVLISGAGPAGLVFALLLDKSKYDIHVVEIEKEIPNQGFAILLWQIGYRVLEQIFEKEDLSFIHPIDKIDLFIGKDIEKVHTVDTRSSSYSVKRVDLMHKLHEAFIKKFGTGHISFSTSIQEISNEAGSSIVKLSNSSEPQEYDLVVIADGIHSSLRDKYFKTKHMEHDYQITYYWVEKELNVDSRLLVGFYEGISFLLDTTGERDVLGVYNHGDLAINNFLDQLNINLGKAGKGTFEIDRASARNFKIESVSNERAALGNLVLVGEAYHGHPPSLGVGASLALEDSAELARLLNDLDLAEFLTHREKTLRKYEKLRSKQISTMYRSQDVFEKMFVTQSWLQVRMLKALMCMGAKYPVEAWFRRLLTK